MNFVKNTFLFMKENPSNIFFKSSIILIPIYIIGAPLIEYGVGKYFGNRVYLLEELLSSIRGAMGILIFALIIFFINMVCMFKKKWKY